MNATIQNLQIEPTVKEVINALIQDSKMDPLRAAKGIAKAIFRPIQPQDLENVYLPISKEQGNFFFQTISSRNLKNIVEFGTSFGISTLFLAAAAKHTGGKVTTTELLPSKAKVAQKNVERAGLNEFVDIRVGDALETLLNYNEPIDFLMLDGWKNLYLPLFKQLEPLFHEETIIYADNVDMTDAKPYLDYLYANKAKYNSTKLHGGKGELTRLI